MSTGTIAAVGAPICSNVSHSPTRSACESSVGMARTVAAAVSARGSGMACAATQST